MSAPRRAAARNAATAAATAGALAWLLLYPTSTVGRPATVPASAEIALTRGIGGELRVQGPVVSSEYGPVQVLLFYSDDILAIEVPTYPRDSLASKAINEAAIPQLVDQSFLEQTADVDTVSGATQTSKAYRTSLQAALDAAYAAPADLPGDMGDHAGLGH
ncbi:MAG: FMN-binding protein [Sporichthyaceae bacterium]